MNNSVSIDRPDRIYYTILPNVLFDLGLSSRALALYAAIKRTAGEDGYCWKGTRALAKEAGMAAGKVREAKDELCMIRQQLAGKPLITMRVEIGLGGSHHLLTVTDIWPENVQALQEEDRSVQGLNTSVQRLNTPKCSRAEQKCSRAEQKCSRAERKKNQKKNQKKNPSSSSGASEPVTAALAEEEEVVLPDGFSDEERNALRAWRAYRAAAGRTFRRPGWEAFLRGIVEPLRSQGLLVETIRATMACGLGRLDASLTEGVKKKKRAPGDEPVPEIRRHGYEEPAWDWRYISNDIWSFARPCWDDYAVEEQKDMIAQHKLYQDL